MSLTARWRGETFVCIGTGPSLTAEDVDFCHGRARVVAINDAHRLAPWADVLYACDGRWWDYYRGVPSFAGLKYGLTVELGKWPGVERVAQSFLMEGLELKTKAISSGGNSGYQAVQVAVHLGATRIILIGYDMKVTNVEKDHFFGRHPKELRGTASHAIWCGYFKALGKQLAALGIDVVNCTPGSALKCFQKADLRDVLTDALVSERPVHQTIPCGVSN